MTIDSNLSKVDEVMTALYDITDPEIGMSIVDLDLIKHIEIGAEGAPTEIKMVLTTPFCPWAGDLIPTATQTAGEAAGARRIAVAIARPTTRAVTSERLYTRFLLARPGRRWWYRHQRRRCVAGELGFRLRARGT